MLKINYSAMDIALYLSFVNKENKMLDKQINRERQIEVLIFPKK